MMMLDIKLFRETPDIIKENLFAKQTKAIKKSMLRKISNRLIQINPMP